MKMTRVYSGADGGSYFEDLGELVFEDEGDIGRLSQKISATSMVIHEWGADFELDWHVPEIGRICILIIEGQQEIEITDGTKRVFGYGDILFEEVTSGKGDRVRAVGGKGGRSIIFTLD